MRTLALILCAAPAAAQEFVTVQSNPGAVIFLDDAMTPLRSFPVANGALGVASDGTTIWTADCNSVVRAYDLAGVQTASWSLSSGGCVQGLAHVGTAGLALLRTGPDRIELRDPMTGTLNASYAGAEPAADIQGLAYDGNFLWQLGRQGIHGCLPGSGLVLLSMAAPATACGGAESGIAARPGTNQLLILCASGDWLEVDTPWPNVLGTGTLPAAGMGNATYAGLSALGSLGTSYCGPAVVNSTSYSATVSVVGSASVLDNDLTVVAGGLPQHSLGYFLMSRTRGSVLNAGGSQGTLCLGGTIGRLNGPGQVGATGTGSVITVALDLGQIPTPTGPIAGLPGETWNFQAWYRDNLGGTSATSNFSDAVEVTLR